MNARRQPRTFLAEGTEFRVGYRRAGWTKPGLKVRLFSRRADARAFVSRLRRPQPDLTPVTVVVVHERPVGGWHDMDDGGWRS